MCNKVALIVLLFAGLTLLGIITELVYGDLNSAQIPAGAPENILLITKTFVMVIALLLMLPKVYVGVKGLKMAKAPNASKGHIIVAAIILAFSIFSLIDPAMAILKQDGTSGNVSSLFNILLEVTIYYEYIKNARLVAKMAE